MIVALACGVDGNRVDDRIECFVCEQELNVLRITATLNDSRNDDSPSGAIGIYVFVHFSRIDSI
jgi:hypothetical protein